MGMARWRVWVVGLVMVLSALVGCQCGDAIPSEKVPKLQSNPGTLVFEGTTLGQNIEREVVLQNVGGKVLNIGLISVLNQAAGNPFSLISKHKLPLKVEPESSVRLKIRYEPKQAGSARGHIEVVSDAANSNSKGIFKVDIRALELSAALSASPNPLDFGIVEMGKSVQKKVSIINRGSIVLVVEGTSLEQDELGEFSLVGKPAFPIKLSPGNTATLELSYTPKKPLADSLLVLKNNSSAAKYAVRLVGQIAAPRIEVLPPGLSFSNKVGETSVQRVTIHNRGMLALEVKGIQLTEKSSKEFSLSSLPSFPSKIEPNKFRVFEVRYQSKDTTNDSGAIEIQSNDPSAPLVKVVLSGKAGGCFLQAVPAQLEFSRAEVLELTIVNRGNRTCRYKTAFFGEKTGDEFAFLSPAPLEQDLKPNQSLKFEVKFSSKDKGLFEGSVVVLYGEKGEFSLHVPLKGELRASAPCYVRAKPLELQFGMVERGKAKKMSVEVSNFGFEDCSIDELTLTSNPGSVFQVITKLPAGGQVIKSGGVFPVEVAFTPGALVSYLGSLRISSKDKRVQAFEVDLLGERSRLCLEVVPLQMDFGVSKTGCSNGKREAVIYNLCNTNATVGSIVLNQKTNAKRKEFVMHSSPQTPFVLRPGQFETIKLSYVPVDLGADTGTLVVQNANFTSSSVTIPLAGKGVDSDEQKDTFQQSSLAKLDMLFVVDNSCSMRNDQANLANNFGAFLQWASALSLDYHIGVITTDVREKGCLDGTPLYVTSKTQDVIKKLAANVNVGTRGSGRERGLETSLQALSAPSVTGCNQGFYRKDAALSILYVSDEPDQSPQPIDFYISFMRSLKGPKSSDQIRISAIGPSSASRCQGAKNCRYYLMSKVFGGVFASITGVNWGTTLSNLGSLTFGRYAEYFLSRPADPNSIVVKVDGKSVNKGTNGWSYSAATNSIAFAKASPPPPKSVVEVSYKALCIKP